LQKKVGKNFILTASCINNYQGLIGGQAYTILDTLELKDKVGKPQ
jgi:hypothetical protein